MFLILRGNFIASYSFMVINFFSNIFLLDFQDTYFPSQGSHSKFSLLQLLASAPRLNSLTSNPSILILRWLHQAQIYGFKYSLCKLILSKYSTLGCHSDLQTYKLNYILELHLDNCIEVNLSHKKKKNINLTQSLNMLLLHCSSCHGYIFKYFLHIPWVHMCKALFSNSHAILQI